MNYGWISSPIDAKVVTSGTLAWNREISVTRTGEWSRCCSWGRSSSWVVSGGWSSCCCAWNCWNVWNIKTGNDSWQEMVHLTLTRGCSISDAPAQFWVEDIRSRTTLIFKLISHIAKIIEFKKIVSYSDVSKSATAQVISSMLCTGHNL